MQLETILEQSEASCSEYSEFESMGSSLGSAQGCKNCIKQQQTDGAETERDIIDESVDTVANECKHMIKRIVKFIIQNILIIILKIIECSWMIGLSLLSIPLKWNLHLC
jgi:hypothetical protein